MEKFVLTLVVITSLLGFCASYRRVCYYAKWSIFREGRGHFEPEYIDPTLCTHIIFSFAGVTADGVITLSDPGADTGLMQRINALKRKNPALKTMVAVGGGSFGSAIFSKIAHDEQRIQRLAENAAQFLIQHRFDGLDIDWEWPGEGEGSQSSDKAVFSNLLRGVRNRFNRNRLLLSIATGSSIYSVKKSYDVPNLQKYVDFVNVMTYDLHGPWTKVTGHVAPLHYGSYLDRIGGDKTLYVEACINNLISIGSDPQKLNLGIPIYANTFTLANPNNAGFGAPASGPGASGTFFKSPGVLPYNEICFTRSQWRNYFDQQQGVPYSVKGNQWSGYDNERSIKLKIDFLKSKNLGGSMVWTIDMDDFAGSCTGQKFPLNNLLKRYLP